MLQSVGVTGVLVCPPAINTALVVIGTGFVVVVVVVLVVRDVVTGALVVVVVVVTTGFGAGLVGQNQRAEDGITVAQRTTMIIERAIRYLITNERVFINDSIYWS